MITSDIDRLDMQKLKEIIDANRSRTLQRVQELSRPNGTYRSVYDVLAAADTSFESLTMAEKAERILLELERTGSPHWQQLPATEKALLTGLKAKGRTLALNHIQASS